MCKITSDIFKWQEGFISLMPAVRVHAEIKFRSLPAFQREELVSEAVATACVAGSMPTIA